MAYVIVNPRVGMQSITDHSTTQNHPLGTIVRAVDPTYGEGEFIYLLGVASTIATSIVTYDVSTHQTVLSAVAGAIPRPVAVAMSANVASEYGWYQIGGLALVAKLATVSMAAGVAVGITSTGRVGQTAGTKELFGAAVAANASTKTGVVTVLVSLNRPHKQGRVN